MTTAVPHVAIERVPRSRLGSVGLAQAPFSSVCSDHMFVAEYRDGGWKDAVIRPYGPLPLAPSISALQYGVSVFEGLKAHRTPAGLVGLFRPAANAGRLNRSAARLAMPAVPEALFLEGLRALVRLDAAWVPAHESGGALYIRPCLFSIDESVRVKPAERFLFVIFTFPYGSYYSAPVDALVSERYVRAYPGGTGDIKPAGNYAPGLLADRDAHAEGFHTTMWLDGQERRYIEECGVLNVFFLIDGTVVTPSLNGTILPGVTRDSVLTLLHEMGLSVEERRIAIDDLLDAYDRGVLHECFGTGTAATLSHIGRIRYRDREIRLPPVDQRSVGPAARERLVAIATGRAPDPHGWVEYV